jgi:hypothetical protein
MHDVTASPARAPTARRHASAAERSPKRVVVTFTVDPQLLSQFDAAARREERSRASQLVLLMRRWLESEHAA